MTNLINYERTNREVYCEECKDYSYTNKVDAKCFNCKRTLVTVVYSVLSGQRITGNLQPCEEFLTSKAEELK